MNKRNDNLSTYIVFSRQKTKLPLNANVIKIKLYEQRPRNYKTLEMRVPKRISKLHYLETLGYTKLQYFWIS